MIFACFGCGETPNYPRPGGVPFFRIHLLGIENEVNDGEGFVGVYHSCINEEIIPRVKLNIEKEYRICTGYYYEHGDKESFSEWLKSDNSYWYEIECDIERYVSPDMEQGGYAVEFEYDESIMTIKTETKTRLDVRPDGYSKEISWNEYKIVGLREGSTQFAVKQDYNEQETYVYNLTLVFTSDGDPE